MIIQNYISSGKSVTRIANAGEGWRNYTLSLSNSDGLIEGKILSYNSSIKIKSSFRDLKIQFYNVSVQGQALKVENSSKYSVLIQNSSGDDVLKIPSGMMIFLSPQNDGAVLFADEVKDSGYIQQKSYMIRCIDFIGSVVDSLNCFKLCCNYSRDDPGYMSLDSAHQGVNELLLGQDTITK
jgi:hypothetical protein